MILELSILTTNPSYALNALLLQRTFKRIETKNTHIQCDTVVSFFVIVFTSHNNMRLYVPKAKIFYV